MRTVKEKVDEMCENYPDQTFLLADGFEDAILGLDVAGSRTVYSVRKCLEVMMQRDGMTEEEATEYFEFNVRGSYMGDATPIWCDDEFLADDNDEGYEPTAEDVANDEEEVAE